VSLLCNHPFEGDYNRCLQKRPNEFIARYMQFVCLSLKVWSDRVVWGGVWLSPLGTSATIWPVVPAPFDDDDDNDDECEAVGGINGRGNRSTRGKPALVSMTNLSWPDLGSNPGRRGGKPSTNRLSHGMARSGSPSFWCRVLSVHLAKGPVTLRCNNISRIFKCLIQNILSKIMC
jgi:hypothetical protein